MSYKDILKECTDPNVSYAIAESIDNLIQQQRNNLDINIKEVNLASHLARYLSPHFKDLDVEIEYSRMGDAPKRLAWNKNLALVYPDIIVHEPGTNEHNLLVIELKKSSNNEKKGNDLKKLAAFRTELKYQHALFLRIGVGQLAGTITECEWV